MVAGSFPVGSRAAERDAKAPAGQLRAAGFAEAGAHDSLAFERLGCCYRLVIAGRTSDRAEADALAQRLRAVDFSSSVRRAF